MTFVPRRPNAVWPLLLLGVSLLWAPPAVWSQDKPADADVVEDVRELTPFTAISARGSVDVVLIQSDRHRVTVVGRRDMVRLTTTELREQTLVVDEASGWSLGWRQRNSPRVIVEMVDLKQVSVAGSGDVSAKALKAGELTLSIDGAGNVKLVDLTATSFVAKISGSGTVTASGKATTQRYAIAGSGDVRADQLEGSAVVVSIAGSGDARVWSTQSLQASVAGSGDVRFRGTPQVSKSVSGSGSVGAL